MCARMGWRCWRKKLDVSLYLLDKTQIFLCPIRQPKFEVKIEFNQRVLDLIGRSVHREHLINDHRTLDFK